MDYVKTKIKSVINIMNELTNLEYAVFDIDSNLIASTDTYLKVKGNTVHSESIQDVLKQGNVIVNKPGHMASCVGCRFVNNCPSTIEILSCLKTNNKSIGIVSLTSFTQEGHTLIDNNIDSYINLLKNLSDLLVMFHISESFKKQSTIVNDIIEVLLKESDKNYVVIDKMGNIIYSDPQTQKDFLSYCNLYTNSIEQMFSDTILNWIFSMKSYAKKIFNIRGVNYKLHVNPIKTEIETIGYIIELEKSKKNNLISLEENYLDLIVSNDEKIKTLKNKVIKITNSPSSVLITGKTGTGKEMFAKAIHNVGNKADKPFISINCSNIPESLFESEMFGYEEGAFTGAKKGGKIGLIEMANGGTLFLDEIGELPAQFQSKLLRVLQERSIRRVGGVDLVPIDIRLISATNVNLEKMIYEEKFREDLFYRINVIPLELPNLEERFEDIELLSNYFIDKYSDQLKKNVHSLSKESLDILQSYSWPGNIRELENAIEYGINMEEGSILLDENLPSRIKKEQASIDLDISEQIFDTEVQIIRKHLNKNGWDSKGKEKTAKDLGISVRTLYRKIKNQELIEV